MKLGFKVIALCLLLILSSSFISSAQEISPVSDVTFTISSSGLVGQPVTIAMSSTSESAVEYRLFVRLLNQQWQLIQDYNQGSSIQWTPDFAGKYQVVVHARNVGSFQDVEAYSSRLLDITSPTVDSIVMSKLPSPVVVGNSYQVNTTAVSPLGLEYRYWARDLSSGIWTILQDYSTSSQLNWIPTVANKYQIVVHVRFAGQTDVVAFSSQVTESVIGTANQATLHPQSEIFYAGLSYQLSAEAVGNAPIEYAFHYRKVNQSWQLLQDFSSSTTAIFSPTEAGSYQIVVHAKAVGSSEVQSYQSRIFTVLDYQAQSMLVTPSRGTTYTKQPQVLQFYSVAPDGMEYRVWARKNNTTWVMLRDYSQEAIYEWIPDSEGTWLISVHGRIVGSTKDLEVYATSSWTVADPKITSTTLNAPTLAYPNQTVRLTASATGGNAEYRFFVRKDLGVWTMLRDYSTDANFDWTPTETGKYLFSIHTRLQGSNASVEDYVAQTIIVKESTLASVNLTAPTEAYSVTRAVELIAQATGGDVVEYRFYYRLSGGPWELIRDYSQSTKVQWLPPSEGSYQLVVHARNVGIQEDVEVFASRIMRVTVPEAIQKLPSSVRLFGSVIDPTTLTPTVVKEVGIRTIINKFFALPDNYVPGNLTAIKPYGSGHQLQSEAATAWNKMYDHAQAKGISLYVVSSYRSKQTQSYLFYSRYSNDPISASRFTAIPRRSEHEMGLALDISYGPNLPVDLYSTPQGRYLRDNAHTFGFIMRYPNDKELITGYGYESWHYRYVGVDLATYLRNNGLTMEEHFGVVPNFK